MTDLECKINIDKALDEFSPEKLKSYFVEENPEYLLLKIKEAEKACYKGSEDALFALVYFSKKYIWGYCNKKQIDTVLEILELCRKAIDHLNGINETNTWRNAVVDTYPDLAYSYMENGEWDKADSTIKQYVVYLHDLFNSENILMEPYNDRYILENLFHIVEHLSNYYKSIDEIDCALNCLLSIRRFMNFSDEKPQFKYDSSLTMLLHTAFLESYNRAIENYKCLKGEGPGGITEDIEKIYRELQTLKDMEYGK